MRRLILFAAIVLLLPFGVAYAGEEQFNDTWGIDCVQHTVLRSL